MNKRGAGITLIVTGAILFASRYLAAAIFGSSSTTWSRSVFHGLLKNVGVELLIMSTVLWVAGIVYLVLAEGSRKE